MRAPLTKEECSLTRYCHTDRVGVGNKIDECVWLLPMLAFTGAHGTQNEHKYRQPRNYLECSFSLAGLNISETRDCFHRPSKGTAMMASKGAIGDDDFEEVDVAAAASRLINVLAAQQAEEVDAKKRVQPSERTVVQEDGVLKERVRNQEKARTAWEKKWTAVAVCEKMFREEMAKLGVDPRPPPLRPRPSCPPDISALTSPPLPKLSSGSIGWRSADPKFSLELFGPLYVSPVHTIDPPVQEGDLPRNKQFFIHLG